MHSADRRILGMYSKLTLTIYGRGYALEGGGVVDHSRHDCPSEVAVGRGSREA